MVVPRINRGRDRRQEPANLRRHRLWELFAHNIESARDTSRIEPATDQASMDLLEDLLAPGRLEEPALGEAQQKIDCDVGMQDVGVQDRNIGHRQSV